MVSVGNVCYLEVFEKFTIKLTVMLYVVGDCIENLEYHVPKSLRQVVLLNYKSYALNDFKSYYDFLAFQHLEPHAT